MKQTNGSTLVAFPTRLDAVVNGCGGPHDLRLRTTVRRDDVRVLTSYLPVHRVYETLVMAPEALCDALGGDTEVQYADRDAAVLGHTRMVARVAVSLSHLTGGAA